MPGKPSSEQEENIDLWVSLKKWSKLYHCTAYLCTNLNINEIEQYASKIKIEKFAVALCFRQNTAHSAIVFLAQSLNFGREVIEFSRSLGFFTQNLRFRAFLKCADLSWKRFSLAHLLTKLFCEFTTRIHSLLDRLVSTVVIRKLFSNSFGFYTKTRAKLSFIVKSSRRTKGRGRGICP